jgi:hypothetical protein
MTQVGFHYESAIFLHEKLAQDKVIQKKLEDRTNYIFIEMDIFEDEELVDLAKIVRRYMKAEFPGIECAEDYNPVDGSRMKFVRTLHDLEFIISELIRRIAAA